MLGKRQSAFEESSTGYISYAYVEGKGMILIKKELA